MIDFNCPHCGLSIHVKDSAVGKAGKCKKCGKTITVPTAAVAQADVDEDLLEAIHEPQQSGRNRPSGEGGGLGDYAGIGFGT